MAKGADVKFDRFAVHPLLQTAAMDQVLQQAASSLASRAGSGYQVITENQNRRTRSVIAVGRTDEGGLFDEALTGTLARSLASLEQPWKR